MVRGTSAVYYKHSRTQPTSTMIRYIFIKLFLSLSYLMNQLSKTLFKYSFHSGPTTDKTNSTNANYHSCIHRYRILFRGKPSDLSTADTDNFILAHSSYDHPNALLHDNVTLMGFSTKKQLALFTVTPLGLDVYSSEHNPFMFITQFQQATELLCMPLDHFMTFADKLGQPKANVILLSNTGRCGSTLLTQMMEAVPNVITMSEPDSLTTSMMTEEQKGVFPQWVIEDPSKLTAAAFKVQCKVFQSRQVRHIIIKPRSVCVHQALGVARECTWVRHIFMYRKAKKNISSYIAMTGAVPAWVFNFTFAKLMKSAIFSVIHDDSEYVDVACKAKNKSELQMIEMFGHMYAQHIRCYLDTKDKLQTELNQVMHPVLYEDLLVDPATQMQTLLSHCGMPDGADVVSACIKAMENDSQKGSLISKDKLKKVNREISDEQVITLNKIMRDYGLPMIMMIS